MTSAAFLSTIGVLALGLAVGTPAMAQQSPDPTRQIRVEGAPDAIRGQPEQGKAEKVIPEQGAGVEQAAPQGGAEQPTGQVLKQPDAELVVKDRPLRDQPAPPPRYQRY
jgi:hypothetical protein